MLSSKGYQTHVRVITRDARPDKTPEAGGGEVLPPGWLRLSSSHVPGLVPGNYNITVTQSVALAPNPDLNQLPAPLKTTKSFSVAKPKASEVVTHIHSVYPAPGHSDYGNTLPHVNFSTPNAPWEIQVDDSWNKGNPLSKTPWLAVMSFTEDELRLDKETLGSLSLEQKSDLTVKLTVANLKSLGSQHNIAMPSLDEALDNDEHLGVIFLKPALFKALFGHYPDGQDKPEWTGSPDLGRFAFLAHAREVTTSGTTSGSAGSTGDWEQGEFSVIVGSRVAPSIPVGKPRAISTHMVSLDGMSSMNIADTDVLVAVPAVYSWTWMAIPDTHINFEHVARALGENIGPLLMPGRRGPDPPPAASTAGEKHKKKDPVLGRAKEWIRKRVADGYTICPQVHPTGERSAALFRGVLTPVAPQLGEAHKPPFSLLGTDLEIIDQLTGMTDVSLRAAWELGRTLAIADPPFSRSLVRLRGQIHHKSVAAAQTLVAKNIHITRFHAAKGLKDALDAVAISHNPVSAELASRMPHRWTQGCSGLSVINRREGTSRTNSAVRHARAICMENCAKEVTKRVDSSSSEPEPYRAGTVAACSDWPSVLHWVLDKLYLGDLPSRYLVPDSSALPKESIRTFYVDTAWLEAMVDGALTIGNHWERDDDDPIRRAIKDNINAYLASSVANANAGANVPVHVPRWGFMIRSSIVQAFPDLRVQVPFHDGVEPQYRRQVLSVQRPAEDILVCLLDREPRDGTMERIVISQPEHQPSFQLGSDLDLDAGELTVNFRYTPNQGLAKDLGTKTSVAKTWNRGGGESPPIFDWENRVLVLPLFADTCASNMREDDYFVWPEGPESRSSALVAAQLSRKSLQLVIRVEGPTHAGVPGPEMGIEPPAAAPHKPFQLRLPPHSLADHQPTLLEAPPNSLVANPSRLPTKSRAHVAVRRSSPGETPGQSSVTYSLVKLPLRALFSEARDSGRVGLGFEPTFAVLDKGSRRSISELPDMPPGTRSYHFGLTRSSPPTAPTYMSEIFVFVNLNDYLVILSHDDLISALRSRGHIMRARPAWSVAPAASWMPTVEPCSRGSARWRYDRFVTSDDADDSRSGEKFFCVRIRARSSVGEWPVSQSADASFVLRGARSVNPNKSAAVTVIQKGWVVEADGTKVEWKNLIDHAVGG
jgi:hypothetical protein